MSGSFEFKSYVNLIKKEIEVVEKHLKIYKEEALKIKLS